jgi:5-methylcytosine-specific restriction endonuclease McrA
MSVQEVEIRVCVRCGVEKPLDSFYRTNAWRMRVCADCKKAERSQRHERAMQERPEHERQVRREWKAKNPQRVAESRKRELQNRSREVSRDRERRWRRENPDKARAHSRRTQATRRARLSDACVEAVDPQIVWERDEGICGICGKPADRDDWHLDHIVPLSKGGEHSYANTQVSHSLCNQQKGAACLTTAVA